MILEKVIAFQGYIEVTQKSVSDCVGQPLNLRPACIAQLIQVELLRRRQSLTQIQGAFLSHSRLLSPLQYKKAVLSRPVAKKLLIGPQIRRKNFPYSFALEGSDF